VARQTTLHRSARLRIALLQNLLESHLKTEAMTRRLEAEGVASSLDVARAAGDARALSALIPQLALLAVTTEHHIAVLLGQTPGTPVAELHRLGAIELPAVPPLQPGQPADLLLRRPDLQSAEKLWLAEGARLQEARADTWPKLFVSGVLGGQDLSLNLLNTGPARYSNLALAFTMPLFNAGRLKANVERHTARERTATLQWEQATLKALQEVENSLVALTQERARSVALDAAAHERSQTLTQVQSLAREGQVSQLRVYEAHRGVMSAELAALESRTDLALSGIQLYRALGGGWETEPGQQTRQPGQPVFNNPTTPAIAQIQGQP
jgi:outer membrane protein TolC